METVFEASLEVEAHMVRDLLERAGIPARVDGRYLQGAAGELPLGGLVKVRVPPERAVEAREIIADWEKKQPATPSPPPRKGSWAPFTFIIGGVLGFLIGWIHYNTPETSGGVDYNDDGRYEERYVYDGEKLKSVEYDRNSDGRIDMRFAYDSHGNVTTADFDDDFDGRFETHQQMAFGQPTLAESDRDGDGFVESIARYEHGVVKTVEFLSKRTGAVIKRTYFDGGRLMYAEYDDNGDGQFERRVEYDEKGDVTP